MTLPKDPIKAAAHKEKIRQSRLGTHRSETTKEKMRKIMSGENNPNYGKHISEEQKAKDRQKKRGKVQSEETKLKRAESLKRYYDEHPEARTQKGKQLSGFNKGRELPEEHRKKLSEAKQGERHPNFGKHLPDTTKEKIRAANSGPNCYHYGQSPSDETRRKMSEALKGDKCYNWKGGITALNHAIRTCLQNRDWIMTVFKRDNFTCQHCGATKVYLHAHHIKLFADIMQENNITTLEEAIACPELWDVDNGVSLCEECHREMHFGVGMDTDEEPAGVAEA